MGRVFIKTFVYIDDDLELAKARLQHTYTLE